MGRCTKNFLFHGNLFWELTFAVVASALPKDKHLSAVYKKSIFADDDDDSDDDAPEKIRFKVPRIVPVGFQFRAW